MKYSMQNDSESGFIEAQSKRKSLLLFIKRKWRGTPRFIKLYLLIIFFGFILFFGFLLLSTPSPSPVGEIARNTIEQREKLISELDVKSALERVSEAATKPRSVKKTLLNDRKISWEFDLKNPSIPHNDKQLKIIDAMKHSWMGYRQYAWGDDNLKPITKTSHTWFGVGLTIIDSLDTLLFMGLEKEYEEALNWVKKRYTADVNRYVNCFEMTIRVLGGFLSAFHLTEDQVFLEKAKDAGDRLIHCFDSPMKTIPFSDINLSLRKARGPFWSPDSSLSEVSSLQLEFRDLTRITGIKKYEFVSFRASQHIHNITSKSGDPLLSMYISPVTGRFTPSTITLGARADSYYEYLLKQYLQTKISWLRDDYAKAIKAIKERLMRTTNGPLKLTYVGEKVRYSDGVIPKMDHLVCFLPGTLALGYYLYNTQDKNKFTSDFEEHLSMAESLARTCYQMYNSTTTGLSPEIAYFESGEEEVRIRPADSHNLLRPEYVESLFYLYHITGKQIYREQGWQIFKAFELYCKVKTGGYTSIGDVRNPFQTRPKDFQESFWMSETLKYLFLLFSDDKVLIHKLLNYFVFNTEAHLIPI